MNVVDRDFAFMMDLFNCILAIKNNVGLDSYSEYEKAVKDQFLENTLYNFTPDDISSIKRVIYPVWCGLCRCPANEFPDENVLESILHEIYHEVYNSSFSYERWEEKYIKEHPQCLGCDYILDIAYNIIRVYVAPTTDDDVSSPYRLSEIDQLYEDVKEYKSSKHAKDMLEFISRFPDIAPYNAMLVHMQKPGSQFVATAKKWKDYYNRIPRPGARPLVILKNFGPVAFVYELEDTEGDPIPDNIRPFRAEGDVSRVTLRNLTENLSREGIRIVYQDYGTSFAGFIKKAAEAKKTMLHVSKNKSVQVELRYEMVINNNLGDTSTAATIFHEMGHFFCGHLREYEEKYLPRRVSNLSIAAKEFEAEAVCWLVCKRLGIKNPSEDYLKGYLDHNERIPDGISFDAVLKAAGRVESMLYNGYTIRKEIIPK